VRVAFGLVILALGGCLSVPGASGDDDDDGDAAAIDAALGDDALADAGACKTVFEQTFANEDELEAWEEEGTSKECKVELDGGVMGFAITAPAVNCRVVQRDCVDLRGRVWEFEVIQPYALLSLVVGLELPGDRSIHVEREDATGHLRVCDDPQRECTQNKVDLPLPDEPTLRFRARHIVVDNILEFDMYVDGGWDSIGGWYATLTEPDAAVAKLFVGTDDDSPTVPSGEARLGAISVYE
jgi:hypothetical protein